MERSTSGREPGLGSYLTGFVLALVLTVIPFALVFTKALPKGQTLAVIAAAAVLQVLVHLRCFLHLDLRSTPRENLLAILFAAVLIFIMVGGSFWIMFDLNQRMAM
jgi:cytochrome o ubiquinol oxidase subunit IV